MPLNTTRRASIKPVETTTRAPSTPQWYTHAYNQLLLYRLVTVCSPCIPRRMRFGLARLLAGAFQRLMPQEYAAAQRNIRRILSTAEADTVERTTRALFRNFACVFADLLSINRLELPLLQRYVHGVHGEDRLRMALAASRGLVVATAHMGNWDLAGRLLSAYGKTVHVLVAPEQQASIQRLLREHKRPTTLHFANNQEPGVFMRLLMALRRGDVVAFQADRATGHRSDVAIPFFGMPTPFPSAPFTLAAAAQVPVLPCFCLLRADDRYDICVEEPIAVERGHETMALQQMARVLEGYIARAPDQWFNFYDIWQQATA